MSFHTFLRVTFHVIGPRRYVSVGAVVRGFPPLCRFSRQSDSWWRCVSTGRAWRCHDELGVLGRWPCCTGCAACSCVVVEGRVTGRRWWARSDREVREQQRVRHVRHQMIRLFSGAQRWHCNPCDLSQARGVRSALVNRLCCTDVFCEWVSCPHAPSLFWNSSKKPKSPPFLRWCRLPLAPTRLPLRSRPLWSWRWRSLLAGFPVALCSTAIQFEIDIVIEFSPPSNCWFCRWRCWCCGRFGLKDCRVSAKWASCIFRHHCNASTSSGRCRRGMHRKIPTFIGGAQHWRKGKSCFTIASLLKDTTVQPHELNGYRTPNSGFFVWMLMGLRNFLARIVGWPSCFGCLAFSSISFALRNMICLSDAPCFGPRLEFFLMTKPGIEVKSQLAFSVIVGLRLYLRTVKFCRILAKFEDLCLVHIFE